VSDCLPQKLAGKDNFRSASDGNKFWVPESNPDEKDHLQKTKETTPDSKLTRRKRQLKTKNTDTAGGAAPKRRRLIPISFNSLEDSENAVQPPGSTTNNALSDLSKTKGAYCLATKSANYVLNDKGEDSDSTLNRFPESQSEQGGMDIYGEVFPGDDEDNDVLVLDTDEDISGISMIY
jgi:hypothetical protein